MFSTPRAVPSRIAPAVAGGSVIALALPGLRSRRLAARRLGARGGPLGGRTDLRVRTGAVREDPDNLAAAGMRGIGTTSRGLLVGIPLVAVTVGDERVGIAAAGLYALAYTVELGVGLAAYFGAEPKKI